LRGGAHQRAPARARQEQPEQAQHDGADHDQKQVIDRELAPEHVERAGQARCARPQEFFGAIEPQHPVLDGQHQSKGGEQLKQLGRAVDAPQQQHLHHHTERAHRTGGHRHGEPKAHPFQARHECVGEVNPQHVEGAVGEIHNPGDTEDQ